MKTREEWLNSAAKEMAPWFKRIGHPLPKYRVSVGFPSAGRRSNAIGECWAHTSSKDGVFEIFITPTIDDAERVSDILCHELIHAAVGLDKKHGPVFKTAALALGLEGKMTATTAGPEFKASVKPILKKLGKYPHGRLGKGMTSAKPKQSTRMIKCECPECGYIARTTQKWLDDAGAPICPSDGESLEPEV